MELCGPIGVETNVHRAIQSASTALLSVGRAGCHRACAPAGVGVENALTLTEHCRTDRADRSLSEWGGGGGVAWRFTLLKDVTPSNNLICPLSVPRRGTLRKVDMSIC